MSLSTSTTSSFSYSSTTLLLIKQSTKLLNSPRNPISGTPTQKEVKVFPERNLFTLVIQNKFRKKKKKDSLVVQIQIEVPS